MSYENEKSRSVPQLPSNLNANASNTWEMIDIEQPKPEPPAYLQPHPDTAGDVTPYLGLRARLSQIWFNRWTILLILVLIRVLILAGGLNENLGDAKVKALAACTKVEDIGSTMASMPHYLSVGVNALAAESISRVVSGMVKMLMLILSGVEEIIFFIINIYLGTYVCLISALIHGTFDLATAAVKGATDAMNSAIKGITDGLNKDLSSVQSVIDTTFNTISSGASFLGGKFDKPSLGGLSDHIKDLGNLKIDGGKAIEGLANLNKTIPNFDEIEKAARDQLARPFDFVKDQLNTTFGTYAFDKTIFPVAKKQALSFCSSNSFLNDFFDTLYGIVAKAKIAFLVAIPILAVLAMVAMAFIEIRRWRKERARAKVFTENGYDPLDVVYIASRPVTAGFGIKISRKCFGKNNLWARWAIAYGTSLPALFVLSLALAGFFSCFCQWMLLRAIQKEAPALASQVGDFANDVVSTLQTVSTDWAGGANSEILRLQKDINDDMFGWVRNATSGVNDTLNVIDDGMDKAITKIFGGTPLENTAKDIVNCLIGRKIETVQKGLTFVHDHASVSFPLFANDLFSQGASDSVNGDSDLKSFLATPASVTTDEITDAVDKVINSLQNGIIQEALISTGLLGVYIIIILIGIIRSLAGMAAREKTRAEGGQRYSGSSPSPAPNVASAYEEEVVSAGSVARGKAGVTRYPSHARKSSYPEFEDLNR
ncbi:plasma membrane fusion protein PRM1 [Podospora didyma]|uniref:Plasma membrane fusion protein PRM1 n=1 Tax=Podospora didyma TaxID=330526 RepID=A0AAE0NS91_9PEZI|nr:plasma membrane fusion protein PRM1 [Podospora didyma]